MPITYVSNPVSHMAWSVAPAPATPRKTWTPPVAAASTATATATAASSTGDALVQGSRDAAKTAFLFGLKLAGSDTDRVASARAYLATTQNVSSADKASDSGMQALIELAQSIVSRTQNATTGSAFLSTYR